jgi:hypothetical protein
VVGVSGGPPAAGDPGPIPDADLAELQGALLRSALGGVPLPGGAPPAPLPDRAFLPADGPVLLLDEHLAPGLAERLPDGVRIARQVEVRRAAAQARDAGYLGFRPPHAEGDTVWLTLEVRLAPGASSEPPLGLGGVQIGVRRGAGGWRVVEPPRAFAT